MEVTYVGSQTFHDLLSKQEKTQQHIWKLREAAMKEPKAYKEKEDMAETVTLLNRGKVFV